MNALQLPPSQVTGYSPYYNIFSGNDYNYDILGNSSAHKMFMQQNADELFRIDMYKTGDWLSALNSALAWSTDEALLALGQAAVANYYVAKGISSVADAITFNMSDNVHALGDYEAELSGSVFSPIAALHHSFVGNGSPMWAKIENLGLHLEIEEFSAVHDAMLAAGEGTTHIYLDKLPYNTANDSILTSAYLGNITMKIEGHIDKTGEHVVFSGTAKAWNDYYDADASHHRSNLGEASTKILDAIHTLTPAQPYEIKLVGEIPIQFEINGE